MKIGIIDYGAGNLQSVKNALEKLNFKFGEISAPADFAKFDKIILPGVGAAGATMKNLRAKKFDEKIRETKKPFLGICLGMQLLAEFCAENETETLGIFPGKILPFPNFLKKPQIGWNKIFLQKKSKLFAGISDENYFYFVHSFFWENLQTATATSFYGVEFAAAVEKENFFGVQFHPEKSGETGLKILKNFCDF